MQGMLATFSLVRRQDLLAYALQAARGQRDNLELEVGPMLRPRCGFICSAAAAAAAAQLCKLSFPMVAGVLGTSCIAGSRTARRCNFVMQALTF